MLRYGVVEEAAEGIVRNHRRASEGMRAPNINYKVGAASATCKVWCVCVASTFRHQDDAECGIMQAMTTISHNDNCADLLAVVRRGPGARPTEEELIEYLIPRENGRRNVLQRSITPLSMF